MLYTYSTEELIGLQDLIIERIESNEKEIHISMANSLGRRIVALTAQLKQIRYMITGNR